MPSSSSTIKNIKNIKKIAVLRANSLGDFIFVLPALRALKETFPEAELIYLGNSWHKTFLEKRPGYVDKVLIVPKWNGIPHETDKVQNIEEAASFFRKMHNEDLDIAFQLHGGGRNSNPFVSELGAKLTVGLKTADAPPLDINVPYYLFQNEINRYLEVVAKTGAHTPHFAPELRATKEDNISLQSKVKTHEPYIILHPGASSVRRRWPVEKFAAAGNRLARKGYFIYVTGIAEEFDLTKKLMDLLKLPAQNLTGLINANELLALCSKAALIISNDTGPLHLSRAVNTPNIGIYWGVNLVTAGPVKMENSAICPDWSTHCPLCGAYSMKKNFNSLPCKHDVSFVNQVSVEEVTNKAALLLNKKSEKSELSC